jgi:hypothetical protein
MINSVDVEFFMMTCQSWIGLTLKVVLSDEATRLNFIREPAKQRCVESVLATPPPTIKLAMIVYESSYEKEKENEREGVFERWCVYLDKNVYYISLVFSYFSFMACGCFNFLINYFPLLLILCPVFGDRLGSSIQSSLLCCTCSPRLMTAGH